VLSEEDQVTFTGNMHAKFGSEVRMCVSEMLMDRPTDTLIPILPEAELTN